MIQIREKLYLLLIYDRFDKIKDKWATLEMKICFCASKRIFFRKRFKFYDVYWIGVEKL